MRRTILTASGVLALSFIIGILLYSQIPGNFIIESAPDNYLPTFWSIFLTPLVALLLFVTLVFFPNIDPLKKNIKRFRYHYEHFILFITCFMLYLQLAFIGKALGFLPDLMVALSPALSILFYYTGIVLEHSKPNWLIGIHTPWAIASARNWKKTHQLAGTLFKASSLIILTGTIFPRYALTLLGGLLLLIALTTSVYSYRTYTKR